MAEKYPLIGGHFDGRRCEIEPGREYLVLAIVPTETTADAFARLTKYPIEVSDVRAVEKAIYTRRKVFFDRFEPITVFGSVELTDREVMLALIRGYRKPRENN
jgi:hypothetical protein